MRRMTLKFRKNSYKNRIRRILGKRCVVLEFIKSCCYFKEKRNTPYLINQMRRIVCISTEQRQQCYAEKYTKTKNKQKYRKNTKRKTCKLYNECNLNNIQQSYNLKPNIQLQI